MCALLNICLTKTCGVLLYMLCVCVLTDACTYSSNTITCAILVSVVHVFMSTDTERSEKDAANYRILLYPSAGIYCTIHSVSLCELES